MGVNNLPRVVTQPRPGRGSNSRPLDRKSDALPLPTDNALDDWLEVIFDPSIFVGFIHRTDFRWDSVDGVKIAVRLSSTARRANVGLCPASSFVCCLAVSTVPLTWHSKALHTRQRGTSGRTSWHSASSPSEFCSSRTFNFVVSRNSNECARTVTLESYLHRAHCFGRTMNQASLASKYKLETTGPIDIVIQLNVIALPTVCTAVSNC